MSVAGERTGADRLVAAAHEAAMRRGAAPFGMRKL
jgi:hypothetical protein